MSISLVVKNCGALLEGPHWDEDGQWLYFIDYSNGTVHRWHPETQKHEKRKIDDSVGCVVTTNTPGVLAVTGQHRFMFLDWEGGVTTPIAEIDQDRPGNHINDGKDIRATRAAFNGDAQAGVDGVDISNGMCWSHDNRTMYYIDSLTERVDAFDYCLETGCISNRRLAISVPKGRWLPRWNDHGHRRHGMGCVLQQVKGQPIQPNHRREAANCYFPVLVRDILLLWREKPGCSLRDNVAGRPQRRGAARAAVGWLCFPGHGVGVQRSTCQQIHRLKHKPSSTSQGSERTLALPLAKPSTKEDDSLWTSSILDRSQFNVLISRC